MSKVREPSLVKMLVTGCMVVGLLATGSALSAAPDKNSVVTLKTLSDDPEIVQAAQRNDLPLVKDLIARGAKVNAVANDQTVALIWAAAQHNTEMAETLLKAGADPNILNDYGVGALDLAASGNDVAMIKLLLAARANPNTKRWSGETPLMLSARAGGTEAIDLLIAAKADMNARERRGQTALIWAASAGQTEAVKHLIAAGADARAATPVVTIDYPGGGWGARMTTTKKKMGGWAPIHFAAQSKNQETVQAFLDAGESIERQTEEGETPLIISLYHHVLKDVKPPYDTEVIGDLPMAEFLIKKGADVNAATKSGLTPLHAAVFIAAGKDRWSYALDEDPAVTPHDAEGEAAVRLLLEHGADPNQKTNDYLVMVPGGLNRHQASYKNISSFLLAGTLYKDEVQKLMLASGRIDAQAREADGATLLMQAAKLNSVGTAKLLIAAGADVNALDNDGRAAMHFAAMQPLVGAVHAGYPDTYGPRGGGDMVETLIAAGAQTEIRDKNNQTPLEIASMDWPKSGSATGHILKNAPQVDAYFFEENQPSRNFSPPAKRLSAKLALERHQKGPAVASIQ